MMFVRHLIRSLPYRQYMLKREMDSLLWKINYKDIQWAMTTARVNSLSDETGITEVRKLLFIKLTCNRQKTRKLRVHGIGSAGFASDWWSSFKEY